MSAQPFSDLFSRDIEKIRTEIKAYSSEEIIWKTDEGITNCGGNLSLHLSGNLQYFFGSVLRDTGYVRDREFEFKGKVSRQELLEDLDAAEQAVIETLNNLKEEDLQKNYPIDLFGEAMKTEWFILHLYGHLSYHLGQINYHRRLLDKKSKTLK